MGLKDSMQECPINILKDIFFRYSEQEKRVKLRDRTYKYLSLRYKLSCAQSDQCLQWPIYG